MLGKISIYKTITCSRFELLLECTILFSSRPSGIALLGIPVSGFNINLKHELASGVSLRGREVLKPYTSPFGKTDCLLGSPQGQDCSPHVTCAYSEEIGQGTGNVWAVFMILLGRYGDRR